MSTHDPRDDRDREVMARARARIDERHIEDTQARWWTVTIVVAGLLFAGWAFYAYNSEQTTASNPPAETTGRTEDTPTRPALPANPNGTASPRMPGQ
jgi:type IV secretory pathway VirB10-like protein